MATFSNSVFNVATQNPPRLGIGLSGIAVNNNSVILEGGDAWDSTLSVPTSVFSVLSGTQVNSLTSNPLFSNQSVYWSKLSSIGFPLSAAPLTDAQYKVLSGIYAGQGYLTSAYLQLTAAFYQLTGRAMCGYYFSNSQAPEVQAILYPTVPAASATADTVIYIPDSIKLRVHRAYHGSQFAVQFTNRASCLFTVNTAATTTQVLCAITFDNKGPNDVRLWNLNG